MSNNGNTDMPITIEKARLNLWNLVGFCVGIAVTAFGWGMTYSAMNARDDKLDDKIVSIREEIKSIDNKVIAETQARKDRGLSTDANFRDLQTQMPRLERVIELTTENRLAVAETNKRIDRVIETFGGKLDGLGENVNRLITRVEVIATQVGAPPSPKRTRFPINMMERKYNGHL